MDTMLTYPERPLPDFSKRSTPPCLPSLKADLRRHHDSELQSSPAPRKQMTPESDSPSRRRLFGRAKIDFVQSSTSRACRFRPKVNREPFQSPPKEQAVMEDDVEPSILLQPETFPITPEQVVVEVKEIYPGLVMLESKCAEVDNKQVTLAQADPPSQPKLSDEK